MARISTVLALVSLVLLAIAARAAQDAPQHPKITVPTRLVQVDVIVRDKDRPVSDLTKNDFVLLDRGRPREISIFSVASFASAIQPATASEPLPQNTFSDLPRYGAETPRSITVVLLDNLNTLYGGTPKPYESTAYWVEDLALERAREHLFEFIKQLSPRDRVAIYGLSDSLHVLCDFTSDRDQLLAILKKYDTASKTSREVVEPGKVTVPMTAQQFNDDINQSSVAQAAMANGDRAQMTMAALASIAAHVSEIPGRKNLVWLTANLPFSGAAMARVLSPANIAVYPIDARGLLARLAALQSFWGSEDEDDVSGARGFVAPAQSSQPIGIADMQKLAEDTGGEAFVNTNDITGAIRKAVEDSAVTYSLGFYIDRDSIDGKFHELKLTVKRKNLTVRYARGYYAFDDSTATKDQDQTNLVAAVRSPVESSAILFEAHLERVDQPRSFNVVGAIDIHNLRLEQVGDLRKGAVKLAIVEQDQAGKVLGQSGNSITLQLTEQQYTTCLKSGLVFHQHAQSLAGATTLRILVEDPSTAQVGSLIIPLSQVK
jgi:VWFA-related protein